MTPNKMFAVMVATMVVAVGFFAVIQTSDESDAATGTVKVNYYNGMSWNNASYNVYDVYQAVAAYDAAHSAVSFTFQQTSPSTYYPPYGDYDGYWNLNQDYGLLTAVDGSSSFQVYVYDNAAHQWVNTTNPLGWYRPFTDYSSITFDGTSQTAAASNVTIIKGSSPVSLATLSPISLSAIGTSSDYQYIFNIKDTTNLVTVPSGITVLMDDGEGDFTPETLTTELLRSGVRILGYGSDAYLALKNAFGTQMVAQDNPYVYHSYYDQDDNLIGYYTFYSWIDSFLGASTIYGDDSYTFWSASGYAGSSPTYGILDYSIGFYSHLTGAISDIGEIDFFYKVSPNQ